MGRWWSELADHAAWAFGRPEVWVLGALWIAAESWAHHRRRAAERETDPMELAARAAAVAWLAVVLALTILPKWGPLGLHLVGPDDFRSRDVWAFVPGAATVRAYAAADGYLMDDATYVAKRQELADQAGVAVDQINLDRRVYGSGYTILNKDLLGNLLVMAPFGLVAPVAARRLRRLGPVLVGVAALSVTIEAAQLLFGWGVYTVDDVLLNVAGAALGYAGYRVASGVWTRARRRPIPAPAPAG